MNESYIDWLEYISLQQTVPQTITTSYGEDEQTVPRDHATTVCTLFAQLGVRGSCVLFSSEDWGVGGGNCQTNDGRNMTQFQPIFPASCEPSICIQLVFCWRLTATLTCDAFIRPFCSAYETTLGMQQSRVQACAKHWINNEQEYARTKSTSQVDDRTERQIYAHPFLRSVMAGLATVMCSYSEWLMGINTK